MMKRFLSLLLAVLMVTLAFVSCNAKKPAASDDTSATTTEAPAAEAEYKLGMGVVVSTASSKDGQAQVDATVAAVVTDKDGKIVDCYIDVAQNKMKIEAGVATVGQEYKTKMEKGPEYNMKGSSGIGKEWDEQAKFFADFVVGKTGADVAAIKTVEKNNHQVAEDEAILAGCTMQITDMIEAIAKACDDKGAKTFKAAEAPEVLLACTTSDKSSKDATADAAGLAAMYTTFGAAVVVDGKVAAAIIDEIQPKIAFDAESKIGEITFKDTKRGLEDEYDMKKASGIQKEWFEQGAFFTDYLVGKTPAEVAAIKTVESNNHMIAEDEAILAGCTMSIEGYIAVLAKAMA